MHSPVLQGPVPDVEVHLIVDTNILLHHFDVLRQFAADIEAQALPLMIVIPRAVLDELDRWVGACAALDAACGFLRR